MPLLLHEFHLVIVFTLMAWELGLIWELYGYCSVWHTIFKKTLMQLQRSKCRTFSSILKKGEKIYPFDIYVFVLLSATGNVVWFKSSGFKCVRKTLVYCLHAGLEPLR